MPQAKQIPVVGEAFKPYVNGQIAARQKIYGSGLSQNRTPQEISYLNSRTAWIKMASSVKVLDSGRPRLSRLFNTSAGSGFNETWKSNKGEELAKKCVLFNTITDVNNNSTKSGVAQSNSLINNSAYGFGGTEFGLQPLPGIIDFNVIHENRGSIRSASLTLKAYNKFQFELIETLYLRLGFTMFIEWGNSIYIDNDGKTQKFDSSLIDTFWFQSQGNTHLDVLNKIEQERQKRLGNYDALFGKVVNFTWSFETDGSYNIKIDLASLGDVVESFKINVLNPTTQIDESQIDVEEDEVNNNPLSNYLYGIRKAPETITRVNKPDNENTQYSSFLKIDEIPPEPGFIGSLIKNAPIGSQYYIRLSELLTFFEDAVLIHIRNGKNCFPIVNIDTGTESNMRSFDTLISIDPSVCIIKNTNVYNLGNAVENLPEWLNHMYDFFKTDCDYTSGAINNIYLNFSFLENCIESSKNSKGEVTFYSFINNILKGINRSFGNICNLELTINEEKNQVIIRDINLPVRTDVNGLPIPTNEVSIPFDVYGYNNGTSNFITNYSFETQISNELKNMLTIGATANNTIVNENATAFSKWNEGLIDRFKQEGIDGSANNCGSNIVLRDDIKSTSPRPKTFFYKLFSQSVGAGVLSIVFKSIAGAFKKFAATSKERQKIIKDLQKEEALSWNIYLQYAFSKNVQITKGGWGQGGAKKEFFSGKKYFQNDKKFIEKGRSLLSLNIKARDKRLFEDNNIPSPNIGFIPINLSLEMEGISGIKIYNQLKVNVDFLPSQYPDILEFVVIQVNHKLDNNKWITTVNAISKPKSVEKIIPASRELYKPEGYGAPQN